MIRALPVVDRIERDGQELVLVGGEVVLVSAIGAAILRLAREWIGVADIAAGVVREFGAPGGMDAVGRVSAAAAELEVHRLVEIRRDSRHTDHSHA